MQRQLRYRDLEARGIVNNRNTLKNWIRHRGFPPGRMIGPNTRAWDEREIEAWIKSRPSDKKHTPPSPGRPGRPRKAQPTTECAATE